MATQAPPVRFYSNNEEYKEFSNYYILRKPIIVGGKEYKTSEHAYQALKFDYPNATPEQQEYAEIIRKASTPNIARELAHQQIKGGYPWRLNLNPIIEKYLKLGVNIREDFDLVKDDIMKQVCTAKFTQNQHCKDTLLSTRGRKLIEQTSRDSYWGNGGDDTGKNRLGEILMEIRSQLDV